MKDSLFLPPRHRGVILHSALLFLLSVAVGVALWFLFSADIGPTFLVTILMLLVTALPLPLLAYRLYALLHGNYTLGREHLNLRWGLRIEEIPLSDIEWVRPASDLTIPLRLPRFRLLGSILGIRRHPDLGAVEFLASDAREILLIATSKRVFAISPKDPRRFAREFQLAAELGSLSQAESFSTYPSFIVSDAWKSLLVRYLWLSGLLLNIGLLAWTSFLVPNLGEISLGFDAFGVPHGAVAGAKLMILPLLSAAFFVTSWLSGLYFYRWEDTHPLSLMLWISGTLTGILFLIAVLFAITTPI